MNRVISITDAEFKHEVLKSDQPVLAYFWANWCGPCRLVSPSIDWVAQNYSDSLKVVKLEIDSNPDSVAQCKVEGVPALRLFKNEVIVAFHEGAITKDKLKILLDNHLNE